VTLGERDPDRDLVVELRRDPHRLTVALRALERGLGPPALIIEGDGAVGAPPKREPFRLRVEGLPKDGAIVYRTTRDGALLSLGDAATLEPLAERLVALIATGELERLAPPAAPEPPRPKPPAPSRRSR
jgi:hypothetical protein